MTIRAELADGRVLEFPDGTDPSVIQTTVKRMISESPVQTGGAPQEGITAALTGGFKRFLSTGETALESLINPELSALRGAERSKQIGEQYAPGASLEKVKQAYESQGLFPAIKEGISQIPAALAEQAPQIAATLGSARLGAMAGSPFGPLGAVVGGVSGAVAPSLIQLYGSNLERQAEEKVPEISRASAFGAAVPGAALEVASQFIPLGRGLVGKLLGPKADEFLKKGSQEAIEKAAQESLTTTLTKGAGIGVLAEMPTEVAQQMLERFQAGLPLTDEEALKEYGEAAYGAGLVGGPFGAGARALGRPGARAEYQRQQQEEEARLAVTDEELAQRFPDILPGGLRIEEQELSREMAPAGYSILAEGREEPLSVVDTAEEAQAKLESLTQIREQERAKLLEEDQKIDTDVQKAQARLEQLEATEQAGTEEYQTLKADLPRMMEESAQKKAELYDRIEKLGAPLTVTPFGEVERVNKQFNVVGPDAAPVGSFKTAGEAEAAVKEIVGEDRFAQEQQNRETAKQLYKTFVPQMRKFGLGDVGLNIVDRIENGAGGSYLNKLITTSLEDTKPIQTMRHESLHAMKDLGFFTPQQWKALEERANKEWINKYLKGQMLADEQGNPIVKDGKNVTRYDAYVDLFTKEAEQKGLSGKQLDQYVNEAIIEETIADAFGDYDKGAKPPPGLITALYRKVKNFFSNLGQALRGAGFQSAEDIFQGIEQGKLKPAAAKEISAEKLSLPIMRGEEKPKFEEPPKEGETEPTKLKPTVDLIGQYFDNQIKERNGSKLDYTDKQSFDNAVKTATDEVKYQMAQEKSGLDWYEDDIKEAFKQTKKFIPELGKTDNRLLFSVIAGIMSPQTVARDNWFIAAKAFEHYLATKDIPGNNPETGGLWQGGTQSANKKVQLEFLDRMVKDMGQKKTLEWLFQDHTVKEINQVRQKYGNIKTGIDGKLTDMKPGLYAFGPKVGPFVANLNGIHDVTVDKWMTRTFNRYFGTMTNADGKIIDSPTEPQRRAVKALVNEVAKNAGIKPYQVQSLLWFYEQRLFTEVGVTSPSYGFSDGGRKYAESRGRGGEKGVSTVAETTARPVKGEKRETTRSKQPVERPGQRGGEGVPKYSLRNDLRSYLGSNQEAPRPYKRKSLGDGSGIRVLGAQPVAQYEPVDSFKTLVGQYGFQSPAFYELDGKNAKVYQQAIQKSKNASPYGAAVYVYPEEEYADMRLFLTEDGKAGFALKGDDIVSVFSGPPHKGSANSSLQLAVQEGGRRLDAFDTVLPELYNVNGFQVVGRMKWNEDYKPDKWSKQTFSPFNNGEPDVVYMVYDPSDNRTVSENLGEYFDDPDELARVQKDAVKTFRKPAEGIVLGEKQPNAISVKGSHYGNTRVDELDASKYGTGLRGAERRRLEQAYDDRIKKRVYFYIQKEDGSTPTPESGVGQYVYTQQFDNILGPGSEMSKLFSKANGDPNRFESAVVDAGYDGYAVPSMGMMVVLNHNVPVNYVGPRSEVGVAKLSLARPTSPAFKEWFGRSKIVNKDGSPMVMYHGLAKDTTDFTRKTARGAPIFLTDDPTFAERFAIDSYDSVAAHPEKYLSKEQIADGVKRAIASIRKDYGKDSLGKEMIESLKTGDLDDATPEAQEYIKKEFANLLPSGPQIMPLYVRAERPFDYENPEHVRMVRATADLDEEAMAELGETPDKFWKGVAEGDWPRIEAEPVQNAIKEYFDSFYVKEHGRKNLAVYEPTQVKSATGNVGTYDLKNPDVRYSLRGVAFPTVQEAKEAAAKEPVPDTSEFKRFIAGSQWLDEDGKAKKFFHATPFDFFDFKDGVIYLSETAEESEPWGRMAEDRLRESAYKALNKDEKIPFFQQAVDQAVSKGKITEAEGKEFMRDVKRKVPDFGDYKAIKKEMDDVLFSLFPNRMKIMPVYARAMAPFDFRNEEHVDQVVNYIASRVEIDRKVSDQVKEINKLIGGAPTTNTEEILKGLKGNLSQGYASFIEKPEVQQAIRYLFDGYNMRRNRTAPISYAVFKPKDLKSITGNDGQFSLETKDIRYSLSKVRYSNDRFEKLWSNSTYNNDTATNGYMAFVDPSDFVKATSTPGEFDRVLSEKEPVDFAKMQGLENVPTMVVSKSGDNWKIVDHQGRHRMWALHEAGYRDVPVLIKFGSGIEDAKAIPVKAIRGQTGAINDIVMVAEAEPLSYANKAKAMEKFTRLDSKVKYSLPTLSAATQNRLNEVTPQRYEPTFKDRVIGSFKQDFTSLRQKFLNRYEALAVLDRRLREQMRQSGGPALLADQSAEFAALQSDLAAGVTASAMGIGDRQGGIPVYKNGFTTIDTSVKGLTEALAPLAKYGDPEIYQRYQFWAGWKRGRRLLREGREQVYTPADAKLAQEIEAKHPEFVQVQKDLVAFNNGIVNFAVQTGVLSRERAQVYTKYADYIPFYRQLDLDKTIGPNPFSGISGLRGPKELKGGEAPLGDFMENLVRNTQSMINAGMKNAAAQKATKVALQLKNVMVERLPGPAKGVGYDVYTVLENGELVYYRSADPLFIDALKSLNMPDLPFMGLLSAPANVLRNLVTKDPGFMMANLLRDSLSSYVTSGQNVTPIVGTMVNFGKALSGKDKNLQALFNAGVIGGYEFSQNVEQSGKSLSADLNKKAGKDAILLRPFKSLWEGLEKGTTASDAATRMAVYERVMKETGNEAEAISRALEVMNFNRKGNSILIRIATAAIPFFNARLQGLDLFYRASTGRMDTQDAQEIKRKFWVRGMTMASLSVMYYMSVAGDDEYEKQEEETKDNNWIFTSLGIRVPIPFEVGTLFKTMPERITAYLMGNDTGKELSESTIRALANTFAFNPIPQTFKPIIEVATNYNFFTMRPIVGQGMQDVEPKFQVGPGTSKTAEYLGGLLNVSPLKLDQLIKGYTGTIGGYVTDVVDAMASEFSDVPKASKRFEQMPIIKRFALDPEARGSVTQFYELQKSVDTFVRTANLLEKTARPEEYAKYVQENLDMLAAKDYISGVEKGMKELREMKRLINTLDIPPDEKRDLLVDLGRAENNLTANTKTIKKAFSELK